jgi:hypothetical protein
MSLASLPGIFTAQRPRRLLTSNLSHHAINTHTPRLPPRPQRRRSSSARDRHSTANWTLGSVRLSSCSARRAPLSSRSDGNVPPSQPDAGDAQGRGGSYFCRGWTRDSSEFGCTGGLDDADANIRTTPAAQQGLGRVSEQVSSVWSSERMVGADSCVLQSPSCSTSAASYPLPLSTPSPPSRTTRLSTRSTRHSTSAPLARTSESTPSCPTMVLSSPASTSARHKEAAPSSLRTRQERCRVQTIECKMSPGWNSPTSTGHSPRPSIASQPTTGHLLLAYVPLPHHFEPTLILLTRVFTVRYCLRRSDTLDALRCPVLVLYLALFLITCQWTSFDRRDFVE